MDFVTETKKRTQVQSERETEDDQGDAEWTTVDRKSKRQKRNSNNAQPEQSVRPRHMPRPNKFKVLAANATEAFRIIDNLGKNKNLKFTAKPNLKSQWIITPLDITTYNHLKDSTTISLEELKQEEKTKKVIVVGFPLDLPESELTKHRQISSAIRMRNKEGTSTKTMLCTFTGRIPERVDLGHWGNFATKTYYPEPLRCYKCQRYGHHKSACNSPTICAVCSGRHDTEACITKHKAGEVTTSRCPNCKNNHPAWHRRCPARIDRIQAAMPKEKEREETPRRGRQAPTPAPRTKFYTQAQLQRARSLSRGRRPVRTPPQPLPRTIYLDKVLASVEIKKYTAAVLRSVGLETTEISLGKLADLLVTDLLHASKPIPILKSPTSSTTSHSIPSSSTSTSTSSSAPTTTSTTASISTSTTSSSSLSLPRPLSDRPAAPHCYSTTEFPSLDLAQPPHSTNPSHIGAHLAAAAAAAAIPTNLKLVSFKGNLTRRVDPRLEKESLV